ncbi:MAG: ketoacyl-ACP synthase III [Flavobacteriaceae bacterium]|nr:ketoacyl-ACP synthase III [Flavobacteriaceae bacterium]
MGNKRNAKIIASGMMVPEKVVPNSYFNELLGMDVDTWLRENVQIYERRWAREDETVSELIVGACEQVLKKAGITAEEVDLLIVATDTPEYISPSTASVVQHKMNLINAGTFDMNTACAGFVTALDTGAKFIQADEQYRYVLVVGAYMMSKFLNLKDKKTANLFADGAGAVLLKAVNDGSGMLQSQLRTKGEYAEWMGIYGGGSKYPASQKVVDQGLEKLQFVQKIPTEINPAVWTEMIQEVCAKEGVNVQDVNHFFFTQININTIFETMDNLGVDRSKAPTVMHQYGYTGSACIPMAYSVADEENKIKDGDLMIFMGSGGGLAFACALFRK